MNNIAGFVAALLLSGAAASANATTTVDAPATTDCTGPETPWLNFGADKFAHSEEEGMRKLPQALDRMVAMGCMPQAVADQMLITVRAHPGGMQGERLPVLNAGTRFVYSESGSGPSLNVVIGESYVLPGVVAGVQMRVWSFKDEASGKVYTLFLPLVCWNWSLQVVEGSPPPPAPPPPPAEPECVVNNYAVNVTTDRSLVQAGIRIDMADGCTGWRYQGETEWRQFEACAGENCFREERLLAAARERVGNVDITYSAEIPVIATGVIQVRTSVDSIDQEKQHALWACLKYLNGTISDGVLTRWDDYQYYGEFNGQHIDQYIATVFNSRSAITADWDHRELYFRRSGQH